MTYQTLKELLASLPQDSVTTWPKGERPRIETHGEEWEMFAYVPQHKTFPIKAINADEAADGFQIDNCTLIPAPQKTLKGVFYEAWAMDADGEIEWYNFGARNIEVAAQRAKDMQFKNKPYGYRTFDAATGQYSPLYILGGTDE